MNRNDLYVVVPGIMGSTLARNGKPVWSPSRRGVIKAIATFGRSVKRLQLPAGIGDGEPDDGVVATGLFPDLHILPGLWSFGLGYSRLEGFLRGDLGLSDSRRSDAPPNLLLFAYDWRLSNRVSGRRLAKAIRQPLEQLQKVDSGAKVNLICHSMGGLVARWYIAREGGAAEVRSLITIGTPHRGAMTALDQLANGVTRGWWKLRVDLTDFARSLPSTHQLLPEYACIHGTSGLKKLSEIALPDIDTAMLNDGMEFHKQLDAFPLQGQEFRFYPMGGIRQSTITTAAITHGRIEPTLTYDDEELYGDGTVPRLSAFPPELLELDPAIKWAADHHGALVHDDDIFQHLYGILTARRVAYRFRARMPGEPADPLEDMLEADLPSLGDPPSFGLSAPSIIAAGETLVVSIDGPVESRLVLRVIDEGGYVHARRVVPPVSSAQRLRISDLPPGAYVIAAGPETGFAPRPVRTVTLVWDAADEHAP